MASPGGPVQDVLAVADGWRQHEGSQEPDELGAAQRTSAGSSSAASWTAVAVRARTAAAIRENSDQRIQEFQQVTWPWSSPVKPLASWKVSSIRHLRQITSTS